MINSKHKVIDRTIYHLFLSKLFINSYELSSLIYLTLYSVKEESIFHLNPFSFVW